VGAGTGGSSAHDVANQLKPALAEGLRCIGATTPSEFASHLSKDPGIIQITSQKTSDRRFLSEILRSREMTKCSEDTT
jgi:hypothetical protein